MKKFAPLLLAAVLAAPAFANDGVVLGLDYGRTKISDINVSGGGVGVFGGYRFNETFAVEVGYRKLFNETVRELGVPVNVKGTALQASMLAYLPVGGDVSLFGRLGYNRLKAKANAGGFTATGSDNKALFGVGAEHAFTKNVNARLEYQKLDSDTSALVLGVKFGF